MVKLTIDDLIDTFVRLNSQSDVVSELGEQDTSGGDSGPTTPSPTKWD
jgi:hypothetical protein